MDSWAQNITRFIALNAIGKFWIFNGNLFCYHSTGEGVKIPYLGHPKITIGFSNSFFVHNSRMRVHDLILFLLERILCKIFGWTNNVQITHIKFIWSVMLVGNFFPLFVRSVKYQILNGKCHGNLRVLNFPKFIFEWMIFLQLLTISIYKRMKIKFFDVEVYDEYKICNELTSQLC